MESKRVLILYHSLTGRTAEVVTRIDAALRDGGHVTDRHRMMAAEPWEFPISRTRFLWRNAQCWVGMDMSMPILPLDLSGPDFLLLFGTLALVGELSVAALLFLWRPPRGNLDPAAPLQPIEVAYLAGGEAKAGAALLAALVSGGALEIDAQARRIRATAVGQARGHGPVEQALWRSIQQRGDLKLSEVESLAKAHLQPVRAQLVKRGLLLSDEVEGWRLISLLGVHAVLLLLGGGKVLVGISRGRPVEILLTALFVIAAVGVALDFAIADGHTLVVGSR